MANDHVLEVPVRFYQTEIGTEPALEWLRGLERGDRHAIGQDLMRAQFGWPIGMPLVRSLKDGGSVNAAEQPDCAVDSVFSTWALWLCFMASLRRRGRRRPKKLRSRNDE